MFECDTFMNIAKVNGRFANKFIVNMCAHFISKKYDLRFTYLILDEMEELGVYLNKGNQTFEDPNTILLLDENFMEYVRETPNRNIKKNFEFWKYTYCQTREFMCYIRDYFIDNRILETSVIPKNPYNDRYQNNNDVYIHVRLGDVSGLNPGYDYYSNILEKLDFENGYISSDNIEHSICEQLIMNYGLIHIEENLVKTIQYASTCKYIILSNGTLSWLIGFFGLYSTVYYPKLKEKWHGDIYIFPHWIEIGEYGEN